MFGFIFSILAFAICIGVGWFFDSGWMAVLIWISFGLGGTVFYSFKLPKVEGEIRFEDLGEDAAYYFLKAWFCTVLAMAMGTTMFCKTFRKLNPWFASASMTATSSPL